MKLKLITADFDMNTITLQIPEEVYNRLGFYPCELEVDITPLETTKKKLDLAGLAPTKNPSITDVTG